MRLIIDASNIVDGGGTTHLQELLCNVDPRQYGFDRVCVYACHKTLALLPHFDWLEKQSHAYLEKSIFYRLIWQIRYLPKKIKSDDLLFVPGGFYIGGVRPFVTMHRNQLPFERVEVKRHPLGKQRLRLGLLRRYQLATFRKAAGIIFLSEYSKNSISRLLKGGGGFSDVIPHGIAKKFSNDQKRPTVNDSFKLLYVSRIDPYKRHKEVIEAVASLRASGLNISLQLVGQSTRLERKKLLSTIRAFDSECEYTRFDGEASYKEIQHYYKQADAFVFASGCETFGMVLFEAMMAGLPIICSNRSSMPGLLQDAAIYCNPDSIESIAESIAKVYHSEALREDLSEKSKQLLKKYSWKKCADETFMFLQHTASSEA